MNNVKNKIAQYGLLALALIITIPVVKWTMYSGGDFINFAPLIFAGLLWLLYFGLFVRKHSSVASPQKKLLN